MKTFDKNKFIANQITLRQHSLFMTDLKKNETQLLNEIKGKSILVIGGSGTIGSQFVKVMTRYFPKKIVICDINENGLTELVRDLRSEQNRHIPEDFRTYPINFGSKVFSNLLDQEGIFDIVANFAAHKHVRSEKDRFSIEAMIENNVFQAGILLEQLKKYPPSHFFCVSTDKAANPVNIMGASKKLMEDLILSYSKDFPVTTARFANVAFSNGSLLDGFLERMSKGQPLSAPSDVKRYFVSPNESGELCSIACTLGNSAEIFFPKLHENQMRTFSEIAVQFLNEFGYIPYECENEDEAKRMAGEGIQYTGKYPVYFFNSDTSGEKSYEEFFTPSEILDTKRFHSLGVVTNVVLPDKKALQAGLEKLKMTFDKKDASKSDIVSVLKDCVPNFDHIETGKNLDQKM